MTDTKPCRDPERIWLDRDRDHVEYPWERDETDERTGVEYVRADLYEEAAARLRKQSELVEEFVCDDGRSRIADLERQLAEAQQRAGLSMRHAQELCHMAEHYEDNAKEWGFTLTDLQYDALSALRTELQENGDE